MYWPRHETAEAARQADQAQQEQQHDHVAGDHPHREVLRVRRGVAAVLEGSPGADLSTVYDSIYSDVSGFAATEEFKDDIAFVVTRFH